MKRKNEVTPFIQFRITDKCNYRCEYCVQEKEKQSENKLLNANDNVINTFINFIKNLEDTWEIHLIGGEALIHPRFFELAEIIVKSRHNLSLVTNFSFPIESYKKLVDLCSENLININASLHLSQVKSLNEFINKSIEFNQYKNKNTKFNILSVITEENFEQLLNIESKLSSHNVNMCFQRLIIGRNRVRYNDKIEEYLNKHVEHSAKKNQELNNMKLFGTLCASGYKLFNIKLNGDVNRCYTRQLGSTWLGNIADGTFKPFTKAMPCLSNRCNCCATILKNNMLDKNKKDYPTALYLSLKTAKNLLNCKNRLVN